MGTLASELGVGRATLYRWFGSREELLEQMLLGRVQAFVSLAHEQAHGSGDERLISIIQFVVRAAAQAQPVHWLIEREPTLALRILAGQRGRVHDLLVEESLRDLAQARPQAELEQLRERVDATIQLITALLWVAIAIGEEPPVERIEALVSELLSEHPTGRAAKRRAGRS
jgi:AcrR family transcriptional regulator